jgi:hypothetical protein
MPSLQEICLYGSVSRMQQVYMVEVTNFPKESLKPGTLFDKLVTKIKLIP